MLKVVKEYTFLDYIMGGCQINFTVSFGLSLIDIYYTTSFDKSIIYVYKSISTRNLHVRRLFECRGRLPLTSQAPTGIPSLRSLCTTSVLRALMSISALSGPWATSSRTMTGAWHVAPATLMCECLYCVSHKTMSWISGISCIWKAL